LKHGAKVAFMLLCCMKTIKDVFAEFKQDLETLYSSNEIEAITLMVLTEISGLSKASIKAFPEKEIPSAQAERLTGILNELQTGKPVQYILGSTEFYGLTFYVNPSVLIPRPETEELVEWILNSRQQPCHILDIGTGSGCIAISLKKNLPGTRVTAIDISGKALQTAKKNAAINSVDINFMEADILNQTITEKFDIIVSNPPYVTVDDKQQMHTNVTNFEPHTALFVPENDPLIFYKAIADLAVKNLNPNGLLFFEANENYGKQIVELLAVKSFTNIELKKDMSGRDRMVKAMIAL